MTTSIQWSNERDFLLSVCSVVIVNAGFCPIKQYHLSRQVLFLKKINVMTWDDARQSEPMLPDMSQARCQTAFGLPTDETSSQSPQKPVVHSCFPSFLRKFWIFIHCKPSNETVAGWCEEKLMGSCCLSDLFYKSGLETLGDNDRTGTLSSRHLKPNQATFRFCLRRNTHH